MNQTLNIESNHSPTEMNVLDRVIEFVSPQRALRRACARDAIKNIYEAARPDRALEGWWTTGADADTEIGSQIQTVRNRARDLGRNNPFICRTYDLLAAKMIGQGIRPRLAENVAPQIRERTMDLWRQWCDEADAEGLRDLYSLQLLVARTVVESGEALVRFIPTPGRRIPWTIRVLEPDWVDISQHGYMTNGNRNILGIEYNGLRRVAYNLFLEHPGADLFTQRVSAGMIERVPAEYIAPVFYTMRPEQKHGVPWCAPSVAYARNLDDLNDAKLKRAKVQACFAAFVRKVPEPGTLATETETGRRLRQIAPGMIEYLKPDEEVQFGTPSQGSGDDEWNVMLLHAIAAGCGLTYAQMTGDLRQVNYSSMRAGALDFWSLLDSWQNCMLKPMLLEPMWRKFDQTAAVVSRRGYTLDVEWDWPERAMVDPLKDGQAVDAALKAGRKTFHEVISGSGRDPEAHIAELIRERTELAPLKLPHTLSAPAQGAPQPGQQDLSQAQPNGYGNGGMNEETTQ